MTASEMHVMFRQYAQQMGMQNVRAILPEQIDLLLNTSVMDVVNQIIKENIGITNDRIITDNSKIGQVNALRSLYHVAKIQMSPTGSDSAIGQCFSFSASDRNTGRMTTENASDAALKAIPNYMFLVDFSISYKIVTKNGGYSGNPQNYSDPKFDTNSIETNYFPVRLIDDSFLADTLNDFVLKNRLRSPIIVIYNSVKSDGTSKPIFDLYIDKFNNSTDDRTYRLQNNLLPYTFRMSYIGKPKEIKYGEDVGANNVDCDLPEYMHVDIVKHAVDLYRMALTGSVMAAQNQQKAQQQENLRNNYRNEGNQQT